MRLQLAIDHGKDFEILRLLEQVGSSVDVIEVGYPVIVTYGLELVVKIREMFPSKPICADVKVFHGGTGVTSRCFDAGANIVTVLSGAPDPVIAKMVQKAKVYDGEIMCDRANTPRTVCQRTTEVDELGVDYVMIPTGFRPEYDYDLETHRRRFFRPKVKPLDLAGVVQRNTRHAKLAVHTGINEENIRDVVALNPELVIVGRAILDAPDRALAAARLARYLPFE